MGRWTKEISEFFKSLGINLVYPATLLMLFLGYINLKKLKSWDKLELYEKSLTTMILIATVLVIFIFIITIMLDFSIIKN